MEVVCAFSLPIPLICTANREDSAGLCGVSRCYLLEILLVWDMKAHIRDPKCRTAIRFPMTLFARVLAWSLAAMAVSAVTCTPMDTCAKHIKFR